MGIRSFDELNKKHLLDYEFNVFGFVCTFAVARTWTWCKLSNDKTERETFLFKVGLIEKKFDGGLNGTAVSVVFVPFMFIIGRSSN